MSNLKQCTKCKEVKPATLDYFSPAKRGLFGLKGTCKICANRQAKEYYKSNPPKTWINKCIDCGKDITRYATKCNSCNPKRPAIGRFWSKVNKSGPIQPHMDTPCWVWIGGKNKQGYGGFDHQRAHRFSYEIHNGSIPQGIDVLHHCDNPSCIRPDHLWLGTDKDNNKDMRQKGRASIGEDSPFAKLTNEQVVEIRNIYSRGKMSHRQIAKLYGVNKSTISPIINRKSWKHI